jgi:hypothetical protein
MSADPVQISISTNGLRRPRKERLLTRAQVDGRTKARRKFDAIVAGIASDLGGEDRLSTVARHLVEAFAGAALHVGDLNARLLLGEKIDVTEHAQVISTLVRIATRIGIHRLARDVSPPRVDEYLTLIDGHGDGHGDGDGDGNKHGEGGGAMSGLGHGQPRTDAASDAP